MNINNNQNILSISISFFFIGSQIGAEGMKYLSESLKSNNSIQTLNLNGK